MTDTEPWILVHRPTVQYQYRERPGDPVDDDSGTRWIDAEPTGLAIALCNCGLNTGWIPRAQLPTEEQLADGSQHASLIQIT